jgi:hypothetical protein
VTVRIRNDIGSLRFAGDQRPATGDQHPNPSDRHVLV